MEYDSFTLDLMVRQIARKKAQEAASFARLESIVNEGNRLVRVYREKQKGR